VPRPSEAELLAGVKPFLERIARWSYSGVVRAGIPIDDLVQYGLLGVLRHLRKGGRADQALLITAGRRSMIDGMRTEIGRGKRPEIYPLDIFRDDDGEPKALCDNGREASAIESRIEFKQVLSVMTSRERQVYRLARHYRNGEIASIVGLHQSRISQLMRSGRRRAATRNRGAAD